MMSRLAFQSALLLLFLIAGCANKKPQTQDITLADAPLPPVAPSSASRQNLATESFLLNKTPTSSFLTGSGATTNIVSETLQGSNVSSQPTLLEPVAVASPVVRSTLTTPIMTEPLKEVVIASQDTATSEVTKSKSAANAAVDNQISSKVSTLTLTKPDCKGGSCPVIKVKRLTFPGYDRFNSFLEQALMSLAALDTNHEQIFRDLNELENFFFKTAKPRDEIALSALVKYTAADVVVVQLDSSILNGGARAITTTQYINWLPKTDKLLTLEAMLLPGKMLDYEAALKKQHAQWLKNNPLAKQNPASYTKLWPFEVSDNAALLENGLAVTYDPFRIAPHSFGKPTIYIPYRELKGILRPELLPNT